jgi:hypothetical protein
MKKEQRLNHAIIMAGRKGSGKSTELNRIAEKYPGDKKVLIIDVNGSPAYAQHEKITYQMFMRWKKGIKRFYDSDHKRMFDFIMKHFKNGLVIFEDCTKYIPANPDQQLKTFLVDHRMWNVDLVFTFHSFKRIPNFFWEMTSYIIIKKTQERFDTRKNMDSIPNYEDVAKAREQVMRNKNPYYHLTVETLI